MRRSRRPALPAHRPTTPRAAGWVSRSRRAAAARLAGPGAEDPEAVLEDFAILEAPTPPSRRHLLGLVAAARHHRGRPCTTGDGDAARRHPAARTRHGRGARRASPEGGTSRGSPTPISSRRRGGRYDARTGETVARRGTRPGRSTCRPCCTRGRSCTARPTARRSACSLSAADDASRASRSPTILTGYGGFGIDPTPAYAATALAWVEAGGVYAIASLRGGAEEGEDWHRAGCANTSRTCSTTSTRPRPG